MLTDTSLLKAVRAEHLSPLAAEVVRRFADDVAAMSADEAAWNAERAALSIDSSPEPMA